MVTIARESAAEKVLHLKPYAKRCITLYLAVIVLLHAFFFWNTRGLLRKGYQDFTIYYGAGRMVREGLRRQLYDPEEQFRAQTQFAKAVTIRQGALPYNHPPFEALVFVPLAKLPYFASFVLWDAVNLLIILLLFPGLRSHIPLLSEIGAWRWPTLILGFFPIFICLLLGQDTLLLVALVILGFLALKKGASFAAGCWFGLGLFRFQLVLPLVLILLLRRRWKTLAGFGLAALALGIACVALSGWHNLVAYPAYIWHLERTRGNGSIISSNMPNIRGFVDVALERHTSQLGTNGIITFASLGLILLAAFQWKVDGDEVLLDDMGFSLALIVAFLVSYHGSAYDLSLLLLPTLLVANYCSRRTGPGTWQKARLLGPILVLFLSPLEMLLFLRYRQLNLLAPILLFWTWAISAEISRQNRGLIGPQFDLHLEGKSTGPC